MEQSAQNVRQQVELYGEPLGEVVRRVTAALGLTQGGLAQVIGLSAPMLSQLVSAQRVKIGNPAVVARLRAASELADLAIAGGIDPTDVPAELNTIRSTTTAYPTPTTHTHPTRANHSTPPPDPWPTAPSESSPAVPSDMARAPGLAAGVGSSVGRGATVRAKLSPGSGAAAQPQQPVAPWSSDQPDLSAATWPIGQPNPSATPWATVSGELPARVVVREIQDLFRAVASAEEIQRAAAAAAEESPAVAELLLAYGTGRTADALAHYDEHHG
ncbi:helix-turn-helix domain-containing protein [Kribbella jejuensis]|uniref:Helix-turn-helix protein n=1 Tax=Kribbella jejuensis TaxID=236068 RepID=A0A542ENU7_9ACTN|nr:hypothetical protein [Kribbella jejuensis]TQJ16985.1 hypothetical protein FB475_1095 [Kribbella jejuensis]